MPFYIDKLAMQHSWSEVSKAIQRGVGMCVCVGGGGYYWGSQDFKKMDFHFHHNTNKY